MTTTPVPTPVSGELTVLCKTHTRRVMLFATEGYPPRLRHMSKTGSPSEFCESVKFLVRRESVEVRETVLAEMTIRYEAGQ